MALTDKLTALGDAIREKSGTTGQMTLDQMTNAVKNIQGGDIDIPADLLKLTGDQHYRFYNGNWDSFIEKYGNQIITENLGSINNMFASSNLSTIPFALNFQADKDIFLTYAFQGSHLTELPEININKIYSINSMCSSCVYLRYINLDFTDIDISRILTNAYESELFFQSCWSLRELPRSFINKLAGKTVLNKNKYNIFYNNLNNLYNLDEAIDLPVWVNDVYTSNMFDFKELYRIKNLTFQTQENGTPYIVNWKSQVIDLSEHGFYYLPYSFYPRDNLLYNSGITIDKCIYNDETYQALKDDPDNYVAGYEGENPHYYSRYDKASAIRTINSLPDTSAYLASAGGTNTIKFKGEAGLRTDGGAINTMTEEEIAVATSKGWTVSFV